MTPQWPARRIAGYLVALAAIAGGAYLLQSRFPFHPIAALERLDLFGWGRPVTLTGLSRDGARDVATINLWQRPGFDRANRVVARVSLPPAGRLDARLKAQLDFAGLTWNQVTVGDAEGWVVSRFVAE